MVHRLKTSEDKHMLAEEKKVQRGHGVHPGKCGVHHFLYVLGASALQ